MIGAEENWQRLPESNNGVVLLVAAGAVPEGVAVLSLLMSMTLSLLFDELFTVFVAEMSVTMTYRSLLHFYAPDVLASPWKSR